MEDVTDTYILQSILAPPRLRKMANTESLTSLNLLPACTLAVHIHRSMQTDNDISKYSLPEGTIFVGLDTGIKTGTLSDRYMAQDYIELSLYNTNVCIYIKV